MTIHAGTSVGTLLSVAIVYADFAVTASPTTVALAIISKMLVYTRASIGALLPVAIIDAGFAVFPCPTIIAVTRIVKATVNARSSFRTLLSSTFVNGCGGGSKSSDRRGCGCCDKFVPCTNAAERIVNERFSFTRAFLVAPTIEEREVAASFHRKTCVCATLPVALNIDTAKIAAGEVGIFKILAGSYAWYGGRGSSWSCNLGNIQNSSMSNTKVRIKLDLINCKSV